MAILKMTDHQEIALTLSDSEAARQDMRRPIRQALEILDLFIAEDAAGRRIPTVREVHQRLGIRPATYQELLVALRHAKFLDFDPAKRAHRVIELDTERLQALGYIRS